MAFITLANTNKIIFETDISSIDLEGEIYKIPIYFFSKYEKNSLLAIQELLKDPEKFFTTIYKKHKTTDHYKLVYEGMPPAYHNSSDCTRINADYKNFEIPENIRIQGKQKVIEFREWFKEVKYLFDDDIEAFVARLAARWGVITNPKAIERGNSGAMEVENYSIEELEKKIDALIKSAGRFYYKNDKTKAILKRFSRATFLGYKPDPIDDNYTGYPDDEVKALLRYYDENYKKPLKKLLIEYYRLKLNPEIKMEGYFLEQLGFKPCSQCFGEAEDNYYQKPAASTPSPYHFVEPDPDDDLPF